MIILLATPGAISAEHWLSATTSSIGLPKMPPFSFHSFTANWAPSELEIPKDSTDPVSGASRPMRIGLPIGDGRVGGTTPDEDGNVAGGGITARSGVIIDVNPGPKKRKPRITEIANKVKPASTTRITGSRDFGLSEVAFCGRVFSRVSGNADCLISFGVAVSVTPVGVTKTTFWTGCPWGNT